jgi:excisionase family DNA binding protein
MMGAAGKSTVEGSMTEQQLLLRIDEVAQRLALGRSLVYRLVQRGELRSIHVGAARRVLASDLEAYVQSRRGDCEEDPR